MKAAIYCRISADQEGKSLGVGRQQEDCEALADQLGWEYDEAYIDNDISATSGKVRPAYRKMLADLDAGKVGAIVAWHPDRLYRRHVDLHDLVETCKRTNAQIATVNAGNVDLTSASGRLVAGLLAQVAIYEGEHKSERWRRSIRQRREAGVMPGSANRMFGWTRTGAVIEDEALVIQDVANDVIAGRTLTAICRGLAEHGILTTRGNEWQPVSLRFLLNNPRLAGHSMLNGDIVGVGQWEAILDSETFETTRAILRSRKSGPRKPRVSLLLGLIYCGICETRMVTGGRGSKTGTLRTYRCQAIPGRQDGCGGVSGAAEPIEAVVEAYARARLDDDRVRQGVERIQSSSGALEILGEITTLEARVLELESQLDEPGVPVPTLLRGIDRAKERLEGAQVRLANATPTALPVRGGEWPTDLDRRRKLVALVVSRVLLDPAPRPGVFDPDRVRIEGI